jgi:hypothetical protein
MLNHKCARLCIKSVPASTRDYHFDALAEYDLTNYKSIIKKYINKCDFGDAETHNAVHEIAEYIYATNMEEQFYLGDKSGIVFFINGFPLFGFKYSINSIIPMQYDHFLLIDINNYIFNKGLILKTDMKQRIIKKYNDMKEIMIIFAIYIVILYLLRLYQLFLSTI